MPHRRTPLDATLPPLRVSILVLPETAPMAVYGEGVLVIVVVK